MGNKHDWSHFDRYVEREDEGFYEQVNLNPSEYKMVYNAWLEIARGMSREGIIKTMEENKSIASPIYEACYYQLSRMDYTSDRRLLNDEGMDAWASMPPNKIRKLGKRHKMSANFIDRAVKISQSKRV